MPSAPDITELWGNFKNLVKKITYDKTEVDDKLSDKADFDHVHSRLVPTSIPEDADLNDYTTQGSFYCPLNATAVTVGNTPTDQAFHLEVYKTTGDTSYGVCQVAYNFYVDEVHAWKRNGYGGRWSQWYEIIDTSKVDSSLSASSANPVQNKVINTALAGKASTSVATTSANGLMSSADKTKLNGIATGANKTTVDTALSSTSINPVQNKVVKAQLDSLNNNKANKNHTHNSLSPVILGSNVDFNNYKTEGTYVISWDNVQSATNAPNKTGGRLEVISIQNGVKQIYHNYGASESGLKIWWRNYYPTSNTWFDWQQIIDGKAYSSTTLKDNTFCQAFGNMAIVSWWSGTANISQTGGWEDLWTLPVTNRGKAVWTENLYNGVGTVLYFKVEAGSNKVQALSSDITGDLPHYPGQLVFFIE